MGWLVSAEHLHFSWGLSSGVAGRPKEFHSHDSNLGAVPRGFFMWLHWASTKHDGLRVAHLFMVADFKRIIGSCKLHKASPRTGMVLSCHTVLVTAVKCQPRFRVWDTDSKPWYVKQHELIGRELGAHLWRPCPIASDARMKPWGCWWSAAQSWHGA